MPKRTRVPTALHNELEEYASLVRSIRTSRTLDLASHLTQYSQIQRSASGSSQRSGYEDDSGEEEIDELDESQYNTENGRTTSDEDEVDLDAEGRAVDKRKEKAKSHIKTKSKAKIKTINERDIWTRWPLLAGDVHIPAWGLDDEVAALSDHILRVQRIGEGDEAQLEREDS